jgi:hypothetical protein
MTTLLNLWSEQRDFLVSKNLEQIVTMTGDGKIRDGNKTTTQLREFYSNIPSELLCNYIDYCLSNSFKDSGLILQDLVNEVGNRLDFEVEHGLYRGSQSTIGIDGLWKNRTGYSFIIEVKTTDAYQLNLDTLATYRKKLVDKGGVNAENSSILLVVGRKDTGGLEAQTRGSKHAWDIRLISINSLIKLLQLKEGLSDIATVAQIHELLKPLEYTRIDRLVDIMFSTSEDIQSEITQEEETLPISGKVSSRDQSAPVNFNETSADFISKYLGTQLIKSGRSNFSNAKKDVGVICIVSKKYLRGKLERYWYAFHPRQQTFLEAFPKAYVALACGKPNKIVMLPLEIFKSQLSKMRTTEKGNKLYWHVEIFIKGDKFILNKATSEGFDATKYVI